MRERKFPLCDKWAKDILLPFCNRDVVRTVTLSPETRELLEQAIYEALVEAYKRGPSP